MTLWHLLLRGLRDSHLLLRPFNTWSLFLRSSQRWKNLTSSVCYCIAKDMMPFRTVNNEGFQKMLHTFEPRYVLPDRKTLTQHYMPEMYEREKEKIMDVMGKGVQYFAMNIWQ